MKALRGAAALRNLREQPLWRLLAAIKAPAVIAILQSLFADTEKVLPSSVLHERLTRDLESLRSAGEDLPQTPQAYVAEWLNQGWLTRRFPAGAPEEEYELSADTLTALRFVMGLLKPRTTATESRLSVVIHQLSRLADETNSSPSARLAALRAERDRIDRAIAEVRRVGVKTLPNDRAIERAREVIALAQELASDFRSVRDEFERLNRGLRQSLMETRAVAETFWSSCSPVSISSGRAMPDVRSTPSGGCSRTVSRLLRCVSHSTTWRVGLLPGS